MKAADLPDVVIKAIWTRAMGEMKFSRARFATLMHLRSGS